MSRPQTEPTALSLLTDAEKAAVLDELIAGDVGLGRRAEQAGRRLLGTVTTGHVASAAAEALLALDHDDLAAPAGGRGTDTSNRPKRRGGCSSRPSSRGSKTSPGGRT